MHRPHHYRYATSSAIKGTHVSQLTRRARVSLWKAYMFPGAIVDGIVILILFLNIEVYLTWGYIAYADSNFILKIHLYESKSDLLRRPLWLPVHHKNSRKNQEPAPVYADIITPIVLLPTLWSVSL